MRKQPRQHSARTKLHLETFERRNLLSGMHPLLHPMHFDAPLSALLAIQANDEAPAVLTAVDQAILNLSVTSSSFGTNVQVQPSDSIGALQGSDGSGGGITGSADTTSTADLPVNAIVDATDKSSQARHHDSSRDKPSKHGNVDSTSTVDIPVNATVDGTNTSSSTPSGDSSPQVTMTDGNADTTSTATIPVNATVDGANTSSSTPSSDSSPQVTTTDGNADTSSTVTIPVTATVGGADTSSSIPSSDSSPQVTTTDGNADSTSTADISVNATGDETNTSSSVQNDDSSRNASSTDTVSTDLGATGSDNPGTVASETASPSAVVRLNDRSGDQSGRNADGSGDSRVSLDASAQAPVRSGSSRDGRSPSDQNAGTQSTAGLNLNEAVNDSQQGSDRPSGGSAVEPISAVVSASPVDNTAIGSMEQPGTLLGGSANGNVDVSGRAVTANSVNPEISASRSLAAAAPSEPARIFNSTVAHDSVQARADAGTNPHPSPSDGAVLLAGRVRSADSTAGSNQSGPTSDRLGLPDKANFGSDARSISPLAGAIGRHASPLELLATDLYFGTQARSEEESQEARNLDGSGEFEESSVSASARGAGLLGSPLLLDVDSLAREAQQFFDQMQHMSQDLGSLLARMNLLSGTVAIGLAVTGAAVAGRRFQRSQHGLVLDSWAGKAFASYPGLGGPWAWQES